MVTRRRTIPPVSFNWSNLSVRLPSNKISATHSETMGNSKSPRNSSGEINPSTGPKRMPLSSKNKMAGNRRRQAINWQIKLTSAIPASVSAGGIRLSGLITAPPRYRQTTNGKTSCIYCGASPALRRAMLAARDFQGSASFALANTPCRAVALNPAPFPRVLCGSD